MTFFVAIPFEYLVVRSKIAKRCDGKQRIKLFVNGNMLINNCFDM